MRNQTSGLRIPRFDALPPLQHVKNRESENNVDPKVNTFQFYPTLQKTKNISKSFNSCIH